MDHETLRVGWIGVGKMGLPMSKHIMEAGNALSVLDPVPDNTTSLISEGARAAKSLADIVDNSDVIFSTIPNDKVLSALVFGDDGLANFMTPGMMFVEMSTVSPALSSEVASSLAEKGIGYLRAPISGSTATAQSGKLTVLASGPKEAYLRCEHLLKCFSAKRFYLGDGEQARYAKLVLNSLVGATSALLGEALALGRKGNISTSSMLEIICDSAVASPLIGYKREMLIAEDFAPAFTVSQMMKDYDLILDAAKAAHIPMMLTSIIRQQYETAFAGGQSEKDFFILVEQSAKNAGIGKSSV